MFITPKRISSPSGVITSPKIVTKTVGQDVYTEAQYYCPSSGIFFHKGIVKIERADGTYEDVSGVHKKQD
jgi:hypothetical protein